MGRWECVWPLEYVLTSGGIAGDCERVKVLRSCSFTELLRIGLGL